MFSKKWPDVRLVSVVIILAAGILFNGCAGRKHEVINYQQTHKEKFSARKKPAQISTRSAREMHQSGHIKLGDLNVEHTLKECWDGPRCQEIQQSKNCTQVLLEEASDRGADYVILSKNNAQSQKQIQKNGACIQSDYRCTQVLVPQYTLDCSQAVRGCYQRQSGSTYQQQCNNVCVKWETIYGSAYLEVSRGSLWRYEPTLAGNQPAPQESATSSPQPGSETKKSISRTGPNTTDPNRIGPNTLD